MTEQQNDPAANLERAARLLGVPLNSGCLPGVIADHENFRALFQTIKTAEKSNPLDAFRSR